jgi:hypothetical protein
MGAKLFVGTIYRIDEKQSLCFSTVSFPVCAMIMRKAVKPGKNAFNF